jgi:hypothetical protein
VGISVIGPKGFDAVHWGEDAASPASPFAESFAAVSCALPSMVESGPPLSWVTVLSPTQPAQTDAAPIEAEMTATDRT